MAIGVVIKRPAGGEQYEAGWSVDIRCWIYGGGSGEANETIYYRVGDDENWLSIFSGTLNMLYDSINGIWFTEVGWGIPDTPSTYCRLLIYVTYKGETGSDESAYFEIYNGERTVSVTSPNGEEDWEVGSHHNIVWTSSGTIDHFELWYSHNDGSSWKQISNNATSPYDWTVPDTPSQNCLMKIRAVNSDNVLLAQDISDATFTISGGIGGEYKARSQIIG